MASVAVLLRMIDRNLAEVRAYYASDRAAEEISDETLYAIRAVTQDCLSALDWTASAIRAKYRPKQRWRPYFPLVSQAADFPAQLERQLRGLLADQPEVAAAIARHQPYQAGKVELGYLKALASFHKHEGFTPQERELYRRLHVLGRTSIVTFIHANRPRGRGVAINPGAEVSIGGGIPLAPDAQVSICGVPVDPTTLLPLHGHAKPYTETRQVGWRFVEPSASVLPTLEALRRQVRAAVADIRGAAEL